MMTYVTLSNLPGSKVTSYVSILREMHPMVYVELYCLVLFPPLTVHQLVDPKVLDLNHILVKPYKKQCYPFQLIYV